jgi:hypothetical protein
MPVKLGIDDVTKTIIDIVIGEKRVTSVKVGTEDGNQQTYGFPENFVLLYQNANDAPEESVQLSAYTGRFARAITSGTPGATGGVETHSGADHGTFSGSSSIIGNNRQFTDESLSSCYHNTLSTHSHTTNHTMPVDSVSLIPVYMALVAYTSKRAGKNALFLFDGATIPAGWTQYLGNSGRYLRFGNQLETGGSNSHNHSFTGNSGTANYNRNQRSRCRNDLWRPHRHVINHTHADLNTPSFMDVKIIQKDDGAYDIGQLPSGTIGLFTTAEIPEGWTLWEDANNRLLRHNTSTSGGTGGADTHTCTISASSGVWTSLGSQEGNFGSEDFNLSSAVHSITHAHPTAVNSLPPYVNLYIAKKD